MEFVFSLFLVFSLILIPECNTFSMQLPSDSIITGDVNLNADINLNLNGAPIQQLMNNFKRVTHDIYKASAVAIQKSLDELKQGTDKVINGAENFAENAGQVTVDAANAAVNGVEDAAGNVADAAETVVDDVAAAGKAAINSISDLSSYIGDEVKNVEDDFKQTVANLDNIVSGIIPIPEDVAKEAWQKLQEAWRNVRFIGANLWQGISKYQTYLDIKMKQIWNTLDEKSDEFQAAMRNLYMDTLTKWYFVMENCEDVFKKALTLPSATYFEIYLQDWYNSFEQLIISSSDVTVDEILASAKQISDTVYNSALANFVVDTFSHLTPDCWPYVSIILQDMANVQLLTEQSLIRMQSYVSQAMTYIDNLARTDAKAAEAELQMLKVGIKAKMKSLIDFTEVPFQRAYNMTSRSLFDHVYETEGIYRDNFQRLLLYCKKYSYDIDIDEEEFASISEKLSDDRGWLSYLTPDATKSYERDLQNIDYYETISHKRLITDLNKVFDTLLSDLKLVIPSDDFSSKMVYYNFAEEVRAFRQAVSYLYLYVSQCIIYIEMNYPKNSADYMTVLDQLNAEVIKRMDVLSYRTQCALMLAINCKHRLMTQAADQVQTSNRNVMGYLQSPRTDEVNYPVHYGGESMSTPRYSAQTEKMTSENENHSTGHVNYHDYGTENTFSGTNPVDTASTNAINSVSESIGSEYNRNSEQLSSIGLQEADSSGMYGSPTNYYSGHPSVNQLKNMYQPNYNNGLQNEYSSERDYSSKSKYNSGYNTLENMQSKSSGFGELQADIEKQFSSEMQNQNGTTQNGDQTSPMAQKTQQNYSSYLENAALYDSMGSTNNRNFNNDAVHSHSRYSNGNRESNISPAQYKSSSQESKKISELPPNSIAINGSDNKSNDDISNSMLALKSFASSAANFTTENLEPESDSPSQEMATKQLKQEAETNYNQINAQMSEMQTSTNLDAINLSESAKIGRGVTEQDTLYSSVKNKESDTKTVESIAVDSDKDGDAELIRQSTQITSNDVNSSVIVKEDENPSDGVDETTIIQVSNTNTETTSNTLTTVSE